MTEHPITPPPELVEGWMAEIWHEGTPVRVAASDLHIATQAARWGADQEVGACCQWLSLNGYDLIAAKFRAARRPKPPSLKERALSELDALENMGTCNSDTIRRALEKLDD